MNTSTTGPTAPTDGRPRPPLHVLAVVAAVVMQGVLLVPFTVASGLLAPAWGVALSYLLWLAGAAALWATARRRPLAAPLVPAVNAGLLFGLLTFGETVLGWTA